MKYVFVLILCITSQMLSGCISQRPITDEAPPQITVIVSQGIGNNVFHATDERDGYDQCIKIRSFPAQVIVIAGDSGGIERMVVQFAKDTIIEESIRTSPVPPEMTYELFNLSALQDGITGSMSPPLSGTVRAGASITFSINGDDVQGQSITAIAYDYAGNEGFFPALSITLESNTLVLCRGDRD